jgi:ATP-dependent Lon protease
MPYKCDWKLQQNYTKGDIVYNRDNEYFICIGDHVSDNLMYPTKEDVYWVNIDSNFLIVYLENYKAIVSPVINTKSTKTTIKPKKITIKPTKKTKVFDYTDSEDSSYSAPEQTKKIEKNPLKRKLDRIEDEIYNYKRKKNNQVDENDIKSRILLLDVDISTKTFIMDKFKSLKKPMLGSDSDYNKSMAWINTVLSLPFGKEKPLEVDIRDSGKRINNYFKNVKAIMDKHVHGLDNVKQEIIEYIAKKISNPHAKGQVLALCGAPGIAKTCLLRSLSEALDLPFQQINFGGLSDSSILTGFSETYVGAKAGKIVEALQKSQAMNMILYFDEIDKISSGKSKEINGVLTHLLDEQQNSHFQDTYLSNIDLDLSKIFFVVSFNDISKVSSIVTDRMKIINIDTPTTEEKIQIANLKLMPEIIKELNFHNNFKFVFDRDLMYSFIKRHSKEQEGMRQIKKKLENVFNKINYLHLTDTLDDSNLLIDDTIEEDTGKITKTIVTITQGFIDLCLKEKRELSYNMMYV